MEDRELVGLLYRADWTGLTLSGTVRGGDPVVDTTFVSTESGPPGPWWPRGAGSRWTGHGGSFPEPPTPPDWFFAPPEGEQASRTLQVAPGRRFRVENADGAWVVGSDGERMWQWLRNPAPGTDLRFDAKPRPPFPTLLVPSWLLSGYSLVQSGPETVCGRAGVRVLATPRTVTHRSVPRRRAEQGTIGLVPGLASEWLRTQYWDEVDAVVDTELGMLLRCARRRGDRTPSVTEFESLEVGGAAEHSMFAAPAGSVFGRSRGDRARAPRDGAAGESLGEALDSALSGAVREAAKTVAGLAAGGLGAAIKYGPSRNTDPFAQATAEDPDPEAVMPTDEPDPDEPDPNSQAAAASAGAVSDEVLYLLYRGGLPEPRFTATLHQWFAVDALIDAVPQGVREAGFGGVGFLVDAVRESASDEGAGDLHSASTVRMGGWTRYRVDVTRTVTVSSERARRRRARRSMEPLTVAGDGERRWTVYADRAVQGPAGRAPDELADLLDPSWLLEFGLSGGEEVTVDGRRGYRVVARSREARPSLFEWWERLLFPAVAVVDAETGRLLRLTRFKGGRAVLRQELREVGPLPADADFAFTPPPGLDVEDGEEESAREAGEEPGPGAGEESGPGADEDSAPETGEKSWTWPSDDPVRDMATQAADAVRKGVDETVAAARDLFGSLFGGGRRED